MKTFIKKLEDAVKETDELQKKYDTIRLSDVKKMLVDITNDAKTLARTITLAILLLTLTTATAQQYVAIGSSTAKIPHTNTLTPNALIQVGGNPNFLDVSINVEYVKLSPNYLSYYGQVLYDLLYHHTRHHTHTQKLKALAGIKFGRVIRKPAVYRYAGLTAELRFPTFKRFFISLQADYDYRGDIHYMWNKDFIVFSSHFKIGYKI